MKIRVFSIITCLLLFHPSVNLGLPTGYPISINGHELYVEVANTRPLRLKGLMHRNHLPENAGMIFIYKFPHKVSMWMKNTLIPLSVAFVDSSGTILNIEHMQPKDLTLHHSKGSAKYAIEVNQGWFRLHGISVNDRVSGLKELPSTK